MVLRPMSSSPYATNVTSTTRNAQDGQNSTTELLPLQILIPIVVGVSAIVFLALGGNVLVIWSYAIDRRLRTVSNLYILNLAVCDLTIGIIIMPWHLYFTALKSVCILDQVSYKAYGIVEKVITTQSTFLIILFSLDQVIKLKKGMRYLISETKLKAGLKIGAAWFSSVMIYGPTILWWEQLVRDPSLRPRKCIEDFNRNPYFVIITMNLTFTVPAIVFVFVNARAFIKIRRRFTTIAALKCADECISNSQTSSGPLRKVALQIFVIKSLFPNHPKGTFRGRKSSIKRSVENIPESEEEALDTNISEISVFTFSQQLLSEEETKNVNLSTSHRKISVKKVSYQEDEYTRVSDLNSDAVLSRSGTTFKSGDENKTLTVPPKFNQQPPSVKRSKRGLFQRMSRNKSSTSLLSVRIHRDRRAAVMLSMFVIVFLLTWAPFSVSTMVFSVCEECVGSDTLKVLKWLLCSKAAINPLLYAAQCKYFRYNFDRILRVYCQLKSR